MKCGICGGKTRVTWKEENVRGRQCVDCKDRFVTVEQDRRKVAVLDRAFGAMQEAVSLLGANATELDSGHGKA